MTPQRIVIHRDWTFTYDGREFYVVPGGPGDGHEVVEKPTGRTVRSGYDTLSDIRVFFPQHYAEAWDEDMRDAERPH